MANWQRTLDLKDVYRSSTPSGIAAVAAKRLRALKPLGDESIDEERLGIAEEFEDAAADPDLDVDGFDCIMVRLYNWADTPLDSNWNGKKACWVETR